jgi:hypothetical protein
MAEMKPLEETADDASAEAIAMPAVELPRREPSPLRPLLVWLGPVFAVTNLGLFPSFVGMLMVALSIAFSGRPATPWASWLPALIGLTMLLAGQVVAQAFLATLCFAWSEGSYWRRFVQYWLVVLASASTLLGGGLIMVLVSLIFRDSDAGWPWYGSEEQLVQTVMGILAALASLPMVLLAAQLPFWIARHFWGCRLVKETAAVSRPATARRESLALRDLFMGTALVAASLGLLQFSDAVNVRQGEPERAYLFASLLFAVICLAISCILALPLALLFFRCRSLWFAWGVALAAAGIDSLVVFAISESLNRSPNPWESLFFFIGIFYSFTCGGAAGLTLLRRYGWRMVSRWSAAHG